MIQAYLINAKFYTHMHYINPYFLLIEYFFLLLDKAVFNALNYQHTNFVLYFN